jgi:ABC-type sugar transport system permease subunit
MTVALRLRNEWARRSRQERLVYRLLLPVFGTLLVVTTVPFILAVYQALTNSSGAFVGLANFARALENPALY